MFCSSCGKNIKPTAKFCENCGQENIFRQDSQFTPNPQVPLNSPTEVKWKKSDSSLPDSLKILPNKSKSFFRSCLATLGYVFLALFIIFIIIANLYSPANSVSSPSTECGQPAKNGSQSSAFYLKANSTSSHAFSSSFL